MTHVIRSLLVMGALALAGGAQAATITVFNTLMDGQQANAGNGTGSLATGAATMTLDHDTLEFTWFVAWQDLEAPVTVAHFHGPALPGQNAGVEVAIDPTSNPSSGSTILSMQQVDDLLAGLWYINIHSELFPAGEIRGQVIAVEPIPLPAALWFFGPALATFLGLRRRQSRAD